MNNNFQQWHDGVHPEKVERRIKWLEKQIAAAEDAIAAQLEIIDHDGISFAYKLSLQSLQNSHKTHTAELAELMKKRQYEALNFALDGNRYASHRAPAKSLSGVIGTIQELFNRIAQSVETGKFAKSITPDIRRLCELEVGFYQSSFGVQFIAHTNTDLAGQSVTALAMEKTMKLVTSDHPQEQVASIGPFALSQYRKLIKTLIDAEATPKVVWRSPSGEEFTWKADHNRLLTIANRLANIRIQKPVMRELSGVLVGASLRRQRFELATDGGIITGTAPRELSEGITNCFNKPCTIVFSESSYIDETSEQEKTVRILTEIRLHNS